MGHIKYEKLNSKLRKQSFVFVLKILFKYPIIDHFEAKKWIPSYMRVTRKFPKIVLKVTYRLISALTFKLVSTVVYIYTVDPSKFMVVLTHNFRNIT
jgi:hypothetical protein